MSILTPVKVPRELLAVQQSVLEDYVRSRLLQFVRGLGQRMLQVSPETQPALLDKAVRDVLDILPLPDYGLVPVEMLELQLVFRHDCLALGCTEPQCVLCQHNSQRRCTVNFNKKYLVNDKMAARCGAQIRIEVVDRASGKVYDGELQDVYFELFILDGAQYDQKFLGEKGRAYAMAAANGSDYSDADLDSCALLINNKSSPLISSLTGGRFDEVGRLLLQIQNGRLALPDVVITDSSEALLSGRKPPFRLVVRARHRDGRKLRIRHAVSEPFVVATRRVRASHKVEIPSMDDPVSKLDHMGRETVRKLGDLPAAAAQAGITLNIEPELHRIEKVKQFKALALKAESEGHLRQQLQTLLKLPKDKWEEAAEHAKRAVVPDNRTRAWYADRTNMDLGLLFPCRLGVVDLKRPEALLQRTVDATGAANVEVIVQTRQTPMQRDIARQLLPQAEASWWAPGHVGWTIFPAETDTFEATVRACSVFDMSMLAAAPGLPPPTLDIMAAAAAQAAAAAGPAARFPSATNLPSTVALSLPQHAAAMNMQSFMATNGLPAPGTSTAAVAAAAAAGPSMVTALASDGLELTPPLTLPLVHEPAAAVGGRGESDMRSLQQLNAFLTAAGAGGSSAVAAAHRYPNSAFAQKQYQQLQQPHKHPQQQRQEQHSYVLPTSAELLAMMESRSLTEKVVAQITAAYEANACPPDILAVLHNHITEEEAVAAGAVTAATARSGSSGGQTSPTAGLKRTRSAAAFSNNSSSGAAGTAASDAAANGSHGAALLPPSAGLMQTDSTKGHTLKRPSSFSGGTTTVNTLPKAAAGATAGLHMPSSMPLQQQPHRMVDTETAEEDPSPFFEHLRQDSAKRSASSSHSDCPSSFETAAEVAVRALGENRAANTAQQQHGTAGSSGTGNGIEAEFAQPSSVQSDAAAPAASPASTTAEFIAPGQSLDVPGLNAAYPSVLLNALLASAAAASRVGSDTAHVQGDVTATGVAAGTSRAASGAAVDMEVLLGDTAAADWTNQHAKAAAALQSLSSLGLLDSDLPDKAAAIGNATPAAAADRVASASNGNTAAATQLKPGMSLEMLGSLSLELPSSLLQLSNSFLPNGDKYNLHMLPSITAMLKASSGAQQGLAGLKQMSLELPSGLLQLQHSTSPDSAAAAGNTDRTEAAGVQAAAQAGTAANGNAANSAVAANGVGPKTASGGLGWDRFGSLGHSACLPYLSSHSGTASAAASAGPHGRKDSGLDVIMDMGQALDEIMSADKMQP